MGERITVIGGTDSSVAVTLDGSQAIKLAKQFVSELDGYYHANKLNFLDVTDAPSVNDNIGYGVITQGGAYTAGNGYQYIAIGGKNIFPNGHIDSAVSADVADILDGGVTVNSVMNSSQYVKVLAGNLGGFTYNAGQESGALAAGNVDSNITFIGNTINGGNWDIRTGQGNDDITTGSGNNTVNAFTGNNKINVTAGNRNSVYSLGRDTITASTESNARNSVTLQGGISEDDHAEVNLNKGAYVTDVSYYNTVTVGGGSTIEGGTYGKYHFDGSYDPSLSIMSGGNESSITASGGSELQVEHGANNTITASQSDLTVLNAGGNTFATSDQKSVAFGSDGLNYTLTATGDESGLFVADAGNETLDASGSTVQLSIYANTVVGANTNFYATGGSGNDIMVGGTGNATFTGGAGNNLFMFSQSTAENGNTVITDFDRAGSNNIIALFGYGLDTNSLQALLNSSTSDTRGNAVLKLDGHTLTIEGVSVSQLNVNKFMI